MENQLVIQLIETFFQRKKGPFLEKILRDAVKICGEKIAKSSENQDVKGLAKVLIDSKKINDLSALDHLQETYTKLISLNFQNPAFLNELKSDTAKSMLALDEKFTPSQWIAVEAKNASNVSLDVTHIAKLTHSSARASNFNALKCCVEGQQKVLFVTDNYTRKLPMDFGYSSAAYSPIAEFLQLDCGGQMLGKIICDNPSVLKTYAQDDNQLQLWQEQFNQAFNDKEKSSHTLVKQVYFPVSRKNDYHLLIPLVSSSLAQIIYEHTWATRQKDMLVREARRNNTYSQEIYCMFQQTAILKTTQSKKAHTNVSSLNVKRDGQLILFPAIPPQWQTQIKPPIHLKSLFNKQLAVQAKEPLMELKNIMLAISSNKLSVNLQRKQLIRSHLIDIADVVFDYAAQIQGLKQHSGWSKESHLPSHQQYWLDPLRQDEEFQTAKATLDWSSDVVVDFSRWINRHIKHKQLSLGMAHEKQWQKLFTPWLREFNALTETDFESSTEEVEA